jgi:serpin B
MRNKGIGATIVILGIVVVLGLILISTRFIGIKPTQVSTSTSTFTSTATSIIVNNQSSERNLSVVDADNQFALDLYSRYKSKDENIFFSPYSISVALAMTYEGARGQTADEIQKVFHFSSDKDKMRSDFLNIYNELNKADKPYNLSTANALWAQKDYPFMQDYFNTVEKYYDGKVTNLDFRSDTENSRKTINAWVENKTNDRIKDIIPQGALDSLTRMVLTNAIYFKANWSQQFDNQSTSDQEFKLSSGVNTTVKMMHETGDFNYGETNDLQILEIPYLGDDISMLLLLPKGNSLSKLENSLTSDNLANWKKDMKYSEVQLSLPKFKFETNYLMSNDLKEMGMPTAFSSNADFTGMSQTHELFISEVIHKTFVEVSESGTEAAAATAVIVSAGAAPGPKPQPIIFTADHPFIFLIQQKDTGNMLFMGRVFNPSV